MSGFCREENICAKEWFVRLKLLLTVHFDSNVYKEFCTCLDIVCVCSVKSKLQKAIPPASWFSVLSFVCRDIKHISFSDHPGV